MGWFSRALDKDEKIKADELTLKLRDQPKTDVQIKEYSFNLQAYRDLIGGRDAQDYQIMVPIYEKLLDGGRLFFKNTSRTKLATQRVL